MTKTGHCDFQNQPLGSETGQHRLADPANRALGSKPSQRAGTLIKQKRRGLASPTLQLSTGSGKEEVRKMMAKA